MDDTGRIPGGNGAGGNGDERPQGIQRDLVVVGASAGGIVALQAVLSRLPGDLPAAVLIVVHVSARSRSALAAILDRAGPLPVAQATNNERIRPARVYVAAPDHHLLVRDGRMALNRGPRENGHRPSVDALFRTAASAFGPRTIGVVLSGSRDDGSAGLAAIKRAGGVAIVQQDAEYPDMPLSAMAAVAPDHVLPAAEIGPTLASIVGRPWAVTPDVLPSGLPEAPPAETTHPSGYSCPDCGGVLWHIPGDPMRFRCRVGHAYSAESLLDAQTDALEEALWSSARALEERADLLDRMADRMLERGAERSGKRYREDAADNRQRDQMVKELIDRFPETRAAPAVGDDV